MPYGHLWTQSTDLGNVFLTQDPSATAAEQMNNTQLWTAAYIPNYTWSVSQQHPGLAEIALTCKNTSETQTASFEPRSSFTFPLLRLTAPLQESFLRSGQHRFVCMPCIYRDNLHLQSDCPTCALRQKKNLCWDWIRWVCFKVRSHLLCYCVLKVTKMLHNSRLVWVYPIQNVVPGDAGSGHFKHMHKDNTVHWQFQVVCTSCH